MANKFKQYKVPATVWLCRIIVGITFIISGWSKSVDPWGFLYKLEEYFNVWGLEMPREITLTFDMGLSAGEFTVGVLILVGAMRRATVWLAAALMAVMLPLTAYIFIADPVSDCGCFGDFIVLSNGATFAKNIVLTALTVILLIYNTRVVGLYRSEVQWLVALGAVCFAFSLSFIGYRYQPVVDFRPFEAGSCPNCHEDGEEDDTLYIYEKDGETCKFSLEELPDSTWTFVDLERPAGDNESTIEVFDGDDDVTDDVLDGTGEQLLLVVSDPGLHYLTRARLANELNAYVNSRGGRMIGLIAADGERLDDWKQLALPEYEVYSAEDTQLKELVRGDAGLVYMLHGKIIWKRNMASISHDVVKAASKDNKFLSIDKTLDSGRLNVYMSAAFVLWMLFVGMFNGSKYRFFEKKS